MEEKFVIPVADKAAARLIREVNDRGEIPLTEHKIKFGNHLLYKSLEAIETLNEQVNMVIQSLGNTVDGIGKSVEGIEIVRFTKKKHNSRKKTHLRMNKNIEVFKDPSRPDAVTLRLKQ